MTPHGELSHGVPGTSPQHFNTSHLTGAGGIAPGQWVLGTNVVVHPTVGPGSCFINDKLGHPKLMGWVSL